MKQVTYSAEHQRLNIRFDGLKRTEFDLILSAVRAIPNSRFNTPPPRWTAPATKEAATLLDSVGFDLPEDIAKLNLGTQETSLPLWDPSVWTDTELPLWIPDGLRDYQKDGVRFLSWRPNNRGILGDDMGLGKTIQALAYLQAHPEKRPALIVCPSSIKIQWRREFNKWVRTAEGKRERSRILSTKTPDHLKKGQRTYIINWDILNDWMPALSAVKWGVLIGDEIQAIGNLQSLRTKAFRKLGRKAGAVLALSGTPIRTRPEQFYSILNLIDRKAFPRIADFRQRYCDPQFDGYGWTYKGATNMAELHRRIAPLMLRREKEEVLPELPAKVRTVIPLEAADMKKYREMEQQLRSQIGTNAKGSRAQFDDLKFSAFEVKRPAVIRWVEEYLSTGYKLILFAYHRKVVEYMYERFRDRSVCIYGGVSAGKKQEAVDRFQGDPSTRLLVGNIQAAGVGWNLTAAPSTAFIEFAWAPTDHTQAEDRVHRIGQKADSVNAFYLVAPGTIDDDLMEILDERMKMIRQVIDGREAATSDLLTELMKRYRGGDNG